MGEPEPHVFPGGSHFPSPSGEPPRLRPLGEPETPPSEEENELIPLTEDAEDLPERQLSRRDPAEDAEVVPVREEPVSDTDEVREPEFVPLHGPRLTSLRSGSNRIIPPVEDAEDLPERQLSRRGPAEDSETLNAPDEYDPELLPLTDDNEGEPELVPLHGPSPTPPQLSPQPQEQAGRPERTRGRPSIRLPRRLWQQVALGVVVLLVLLQLIGTFGGGSSHHYSNTTSAPPPTTAAGVAANALVTETVVPAVEQVPAMEVKIHDNNPGVFYAEYSGGVVYLYRVSASGRKTLEEIYKNGGAWTRNGGDCWRESSPPKEINPRNLIVLLNPATAASFTTSAGSTIKAAGTIKTNNATESFTGLIKVNSTTHLPASYSLKGSGGTISEGEVSYPNAITFPTPKPLCH